MMRILRHFCLGLFLSLLFVNFSTGQSAVKVIGTVTRPTGQPVEFATVALRSLPDSVLVSGTITGEAGSFSFDVPAMQDGLLQVTCVGFKPFSGKLSLSEREVIDAGSIQLSSRSYALNEVRAVRERIKAKSTSTGTTYFVNSYMQKASASGIDVVKFIPGVQVDMMQNVLVEGSENVMILVDGIERSPDFLGQLNSDLINKVEINHQPGAQYRSDLTAVVNVVTRKKSSKGISGHVYGEVPFSSNEIYSFPSAGVLVSSKSLNIFGSYRGEFSYFDIEAENEKRIFGEQDVVLKNRELVNQENWSHKVMGGLDWFPDSNNQVNLYAFVNPYSNEQDGHVTAIRQTGTNIDFKNVLVKDDLDDNLAFGGSVFYKHLFDSQDQTLSLEANYYQLEGRRGAKYTGNNEVVSAYSDPYEKNFVGKVRYQLSLNSRWNMTTGGEERFRKLGDAEGLEANYQENILAGFGSFTFQSGKVSGHAGVRAEYLRAKAQTEGVEEELSVFPFFSFSYKPAEKQKLTGSYRRSVVRPHVFQLLPSALSTDIFTRQQGNPFLNPEYKDELALEYSLFAGNQFLALGPFYSKSTDVIAYLTTMQNSGEFFRKSHNLGNITRLGFRFKAVLKPFKRLLFNPYLRVFHLKTNPGESAVTSQIVSEQQWTSEWGFGLSLQMNYGISFSSSGMQRADVHRIQSTSFEDFLYFVSLEKKFFSNLTAGITSAVPLAETVTYQGHSLVGAGFTENVEDKILTSKFPLWFKLKYTFSSGVKRERIQNPDIFENKRVRKGF